MSRSTEVQLDEGYDDGTRPLANEPNSEELQVTRLLQSLNNWNEAQKTQFALQLLKSLHSSTVIKVVDDITVWLYRDFISQLPIELAHHILKFLDVPSIFRASQVSRQWKVIIDSNTLWQYFYERNGWSVDTQLVKWYNAYGELLRQEQQLYNGTMRVCHVNDIPISRGMATSPGTYQELQRRLTSAMEELSINTHALPNIKQNQLYKQSRPHHSQNIATIDARSYVALCYSGIIQNPVKDLVLGHEMSSLRIVDYPVFPLWEVSMTGNQMILQPSTDTTDITEINAKTFHIPHRLRCNILINWRNLYLTRCGIQRRWDTSMYTVQRLQGHREGIYCIQFDSQKIISGARDSSIRLWDMAKKQYILISGGCDAIAIIWDMKTGAIIHTLRGHTNFVLGLCFNAKYIVTCSKDCSIRVWCRTTYKLLNIITSHRIAVNAVALRDNILVSVSGDRSLCVWDLDTNTCLHKIVGHTRGIACVYFDGKRIFTGSSDRTIRIWDVKTGACLGILEGHEQLVRSLDFNGRLLVSASYDCTIRIWDPDTLRPIDVLRHGHTNRIIKVQFNESKIVSCSQDCSIVIWDYAHRIDTTFIV
ncbi:WD40-repeat-containing domain protein [Syncephalis plumigaleata]|nr:WD40-repeat-containing domain protein [Syncephalis plumigaleata]